jgi:serine O-acetyltransferase
MAAPCSEEVLRALTDIRQRQCFPTQLRGFASQIVESSLALLFPHFASGRSVQEELDQLCTSMHGAASLVHYESPLDPFIERFAAIHEALQEDAAAMNDGDPAANGVDEVILAYPGFYAIAVHRVAHELYRLGVQVLPRLLSECAHSRTGIDIHPGAQIGRRFFIDHGTGLVIGESAKIGNDVKLYQGVTLGALTVDKEMAATKRHPTLEDGVVVYANATILGGNTVIGAGALIGGNVWLTRSVPPRAVVTHQPEIRMRAPGEEQPLEFHI